MVKSLLRLEVAVERSVVRNMLKVRVSLSLAPAVTSTLDIVEVT